MSAIVKVTRRDFLRYSGVGAGALVLGCHVGSLLARETPAEFELNSFVAIQADGTVVIITHRSEMGQGIRSSLPAVLADELEADWDRVQLRQADANAHRYGIPNPVPGGRPAEIVKGHESQFTDSSRSMAAYFQPMRLFGAAARLMLIGAAAQIFGVDASGCEARGHRVRHPASGRSLDYGDLVARAASLPAPGVTEIQSALKKPGDWRYIGKEMPFFDADDMITGKAVYGGDVDVPDHPGMLTAMIERCPVANGDIKSFDPTDALKVPGVKSVVPVYPAELPPPPLFPRGGVGGGFLPHAGVAVIAENTWAAWQGRKALKVEWELGPFADAKFDSHTFRGLLEQSAANPGTTLRCRGDVDAAFGEASRIVEASYHVPYLAQAPMEPPVAVALYENGRWEIWSPTQGAQITQQYVGLTMLHRHNPVEWLAFGDPEKPSPVPGSTQFPLGETPVQERFREALRTVLGWDEAEERRFREGLQKKIRENITVHVTLLGGGFGRKSKPDYAIEAAFLAERNPGVPIRVQWTREDDIKFSYYNATANQYLKAALDGEGKTQAWLQRSAFPSFFATLFPPPVDPRVPPPVADLFAKARAAFHCGGEYPTASATERAQGLEDMPFDVPNLRLENCAAHSHIRNGWMRSVANVYHAFAIGSFADELANAAGRDSKDYLLELIGAGRLIDFPKEGTAQFDNNQFPTEPAGEPVKVIPGYPADTGRLRGVVERVAREADWDNRKARLPQGHGLGIAAHRSFLSYVAMVIEVSLNDRDELTIHEIWAAIDCGTAVNPDRILAQMEGGIIYGLSLALLGEITVKDGAVEQNNFDDYPVLRMHQTPRKISSYIVPSEMPPTGVGEPPVPPVAPALCNAIAAAGGPRIRELPLWKNIKVL